MKNVFAALLLVATSANAEEQKPIVIQAGVSIAHYAKAVLDTVSRAVICKKNLFAKDAYTSSRDTVSTRMHAQSGLIVKIIINKLKVCANVLGNT